MSAPTAIGRHRVVRRLGAGGFATVWLAHDPELDAPVAVKVLADNWSEHADVRRRFVDEARLLRRVDSDHLVRVYDIGELPDGRPYFVMTFADAGSLADRLAERPPPWPPHEVLRIVDAIAAGLDVLHRHGVVHRDLKPNNVLLRGTPDGPPRVLLGDLGIAKDLHWASGITMPVGSDGYMAPEQRGYSERIGPASDVHALAVTTGHLLGLTGGPWPATPLGTVLARGTAADPARRTSSAGEFAALLRRALAGPTPGPVPPPPPRQPPPAPPAPPAPAAPAPPAEIDATAIVAPGAVTRPAAPDRTGRPRPRRWALITAGAVPALLVVGAVVAHDRLDRGRRITSADGALGITVPRSWTGGDDTFPGASERAAGVRADDGPRAVRAAHLAATRPVRDVLTDAAPTGCTADEVRDTVVGAWSGVTVRYPSCPDQVTVHEVVLRGPGSAGGTVWVEVRSVAGRPDVGDVLSDLRLPPTD